MFSHSAALEYNKASNVKRDQSEHNRIDFRRVPILGRKEIYNLGFHSFESQTYLRKHSELMFLIDLRQIYRRASSIPFLQEAVRLF